jgi:hypothetical protein
MCETQEIRYVHTMVHPDYANELRVGCVCAEKIEGEYIGPRLREKAPRSAAVRKKRWLPADGGSRHAGTRTSW